MTSMLVVGLFFRWASFLQSRKEDAYFSTFTSEIDKLIYTYKEKTAQISDVDKFLAELLEDVKDKLPNRSIRDKSHNKNKSKADKLGAKNVVSLREYATGDQSFFLAIKSESASFKSKFPPNYNELTDRILENESAWNKLFSFFPIAPISRLIDILPGLFVVFGIFGTFIGISMALPEIAKIDFNNLDASGEILTQFVKSVTYAMQTSIAGIMFSLVTTFLNTIAPVTGMRKKTHKKIANCFENVWHAVHGDQDERTLQQTIPALLEEVKAIRLEMNNSKTNEELKKESA